MELMLRVADGVGADLAPIINRARHTISRAEANKLTVRKGRLKRKA
jgi:hypothetical protein